jgi:hypothetical protein
MSNLRNSASVDRPPTAKVNSAGFEDALVNPAGVALCRAKTRAGIACAEVPCEGKRRCRVHGGAPGSGAPVGEKNGRYKHGRYSRPKRAERRAARALEFEARRAGERAWESNPRATIDYSAICDVIAAERSGGSEQ